MCDAVAQLGVLGVDGVDGEVGEGGGEAGGRDGRGLGGHCFGLEWGGGLGRIWLARLVGKERWVKRGG